MEEYTATFDIESAADARTVSRVLDDLYDRLREEDLRVREGETVANQMLAEFRALQSEFDAGSTGQLVVTYRSESPE